MHIRRIASTIMIVAGLSLIVAGCAGCAGIFDFTGENARRAAEQNASAQLQQTYQHALDRTAALELLNAQENARAQYLAQAAQQARDYYAFLVNQARMDPVEAATKVFSPAPTPPILLILIAGVALGAIAALGGLYLWSRRTA